MRIKEHDLRCFCRGNPLLATFGLNREGKLFVHVKIYKQGRIYGELVIEGGIANIRCRNCLRWHRIVFRDKSAELSEVEAPEAQANIG